MTYSILKNYRDKITKTDLQSMVQSFRTIPFRKRTDSILVQGYLEDRLRQIVNIYKRCNTGESKYYMLDIAHLEPLLHLIYDYKLSELDIKILSDFLSVLPNYFSIPVHETVEWLIPKLDSVLIHLEDFKPITELFSYYLQAEPHADHLKILDKCIEVLNIKKLAA